MQIVTSSDCSAMGRNTSESVADDILLPKRARKWGRQASMIVQSLSKCDTNAVEGSLELTECCMELKVPHTAVWEYQFVWVRNWGIDMAPDLGIEMKGVIVGSTRPRPSFRGPKKVFQEWVCLVGETFPHPVLAFCPTPRPPSGHIGPKIDFFVDFGFRVFP